MMLNYSYENVTLIDNSENASVGTLLYVIIQVLLFGLGVILQLRIIVVARKEKDTTWQIYICHSSLLIICYSFTIFFSGLMNFGPSTSIYTGSWICYFALSLHVYCYYAITSHTLLVAVMKFIFIVHLEKVIAFGKEKVKLIFLLINLCLPLFWTTLAILSYENNSTPSINTCFQQLVLSTNTTSSGTIKTIFCEFGHQAKVWEHGYILYIIKRCCCIFLEIVYVAISSNLPEAFFYYKIFRKMRR